MRQRQKQDGVGYFQRTNECCKMEVGEGLKLMDGRNGMEWIEIGEGRGLVEVEEGN